MATGATNVIPLQQEPRQATAEPQEQVTAFVRIARVKEISGLSKSTLLRWMYGTPGDPAKGTQPRPPRGFPLPVVNDGNTVLWDLAEVMEWRQQQFFKREQRQGVNQK